MKKVLPLVLTLSIIAPVMAAKGNFSYSAPSPQNVAAPQQNLKGSVVYVPSGVSTNAVTTGVISSAYLAPGSPVNLTLPSNFMYNGKLVAPAGSMVSGSVITCKKAGRTGKNGQLQVRFNSIITTTGQRIPISAVIKTSDNTGILKGATAKDTTIDYAKNTAIGAGAGAALGTAMGAIVNGKEGLGKGAIYGTAIGGTLGVGKALINKGEDVVIPVGATLQIFFDQPTTFNASNSYYY